MIILRRDCAIAGSKTARSARASARKRRAFAGKITFLLSPLPRPLFRGSVDFAGVKTTDLGSADSKGVTGGVFVSADSKGFTKNRGARSCGPSEYMRECNLVVH